MKLKLCALSGILLALSSLQSEATISFIIQGDLLTTSDGSPIPESSLIMLVASTSDSTFAPIVEGSSSARGSQLTPGSDDYIVFRSLTGTGYGAGVVDLATGGLDLASIPGWTPGDPLALVWFPTLNSNSSLISANTRYGIYSNPLPPQGAPWLTPNDGVTNHVLALLTPNGADLGPGTVPVIEARAGNTVAAVPEPGSVALLALGFAGLAARRRRA